MEHDGSITSEGEGWSSWSLEETRLSREEAFDAWSPHFTFNDSEYCISLFKHKETFLIHIGLHRLDREPLGSLSVEVELRAENERAAHLHSVTLRDETSRHVVCATSFAEFLSRRTDGTYRGPLVLRFRLREEPPGGRRGAGAEVAEESNEALEKDSGSEAERNDVTSATVSCAVKRNDEPDRATEEESCQVDTNTESISVSDKPAGNDGTLLEISRGVKWEVPLPPPMTTWDLLSPEFTFGGIKYHFSLYSSVLTSHVIYLGLILNIPRDADFPLPIRWRVALKRKDGDGLRWIMRGQMTAQHECYQHIQEICIKRAELESSISSVGRLTFVNHLSIGEVDEEKEVSTQTGPLVVNELDVPDVHGELRYRTIS